MLVAMEWGIFIKHTSDVYTNWYALYVHPVFASAAFHPHKRILLYALVWSQVETAGVCVTGGYCCCLLFFLSCLDFCDCFSSRFRFLSSLAFTFCCFSSALAFFMPIISSLVSILSPVSFFLACSVFP